MDASRGPDFGASFVVVSERAANWPPLRDGKPSDEKVDEPEILFSEWHNLANTSVSGVSEVMAAPSKSTTCNRPPDQAHSLPAEERAPFDRLITNWTD